MVRPLFSVIALGALILASGAGCNSLSGADKILPFAATPSASPAAKAVVSSSFNALEKSIYEQINQYRQSRNLPPLTLDPRISQQALAHSQEMASGSVPFGHQGFEQRVEAISRVINYSGAAENVAYNQGYSNPATQAVQGWLKSPGHLANIQGDYDLTGVGVIKNAKGEYYFTQIFIRQR